jgi:hypothetical protein
MTSFNLMMLRSLPILLSNRYATPRVTEATKTAFEITGILGRVTPQERIAARSALTTLDSSATQSPGALAQ